jgi:hypothetical protein
MKANVCLRLHHLGIFNAFENSFEKSNNFVHKFAASLSTTLLFSIFYTAMQHKEANIFTIALSQKVHQIFNEM